MNNFEKIKQYIHKEYGVPIEDIHAEAELLDLGLDSLDQVELVMYLEEEYGIEISDEEFDNLTTVKELESLISSKAQ